MKLDPARLTSGPVGAKLAFMFFTPSSTPTPTTVRRSYRNIKLTSLVKSGLCETSKWAIREGTLSDSFYLKVPNTPATRELVKALNALTPPAATYFSPTGHILARQWRLSKHNHRNLWASPLGTRLDEP